mmetsp:Transcript_47244/g.93610  ORF Transcript_47244/g.93610 Transcript_47244/m.93610 type:complete len:99 (-) Transcript_47244:135-431(-)
MHLRDLQQHRHIEKETPPGRVAQRVEEASQSTPKDQNPTEAMCQKLHPAKGGNCIAESTHECIDIHPFMGRKMKMRARTTKKIKKGKTHLNFEELVLV